ncbi:5-formyltetrahydrofolate cyclo-ligase [Thermostilla marina]
MPEESLEDQKRILRRRMRSLTASVKDRAGRSARIVDKLVRLDCYRDARTLFVFVAMPHEVETRSLIETALREGKRVGVPFCLPRRQLGVFDCRRLDELVPGEFGIDEPPTSLRASPDRRIAPEEIDLVVVPGLAFDRRGYRLGHGGGYYDRFLPSASDAVRAAIAFDCQIVDAVPHDERDQRVDLIVTETQVVECRRRA